MLRRSSPSAHPAARRLRAAFALLVLLAPGTLAAQARRPSATAVAVTATPPSSPDRAVALREVWSAEIAFARMALDSGTDAAFAANMSDSSILFRPGPVNGAKWTREHLAPRTAELLAWEPRLVDVAASGDFGFSVGPWEVREHGAADTVVAARGTYSSVWVKDGGGRWRALMDGGSCGAVDGWSLRAGRHGSWSSPAPAAPAASADSARAALLAADSAAGTSTEALAASLDEAAWLCRRGSAPVIGGAAARQALASGAAAGALRAVPLGASMARSGDLAYTYGRVERATDAGPERGHYVRFWRRDADGRWRVVLDSMMPLPAGAAGE